jgi:AcrR family transcriptional regulator
MAYKKSVLTRQRIIDATKTLFNEKGYNDTNIKDIAKVADIAHPCVYYYFKNKESIAREMFDEIMEKVYQTAAVVCKNNSDQLVNIMIEYILVFMHVAVNKTTQTVFYELVQYANYDQDNLDRIKQLYYKRMSALLLTYHVQLDDKQVTAYILTSDAFMKSLFKGIMNGLLDFTLKEASDYFFRHMLLGLIDLSEQEYVESFEIAFGICEKVNLDEISAL